MDPHACPFVNKLTMRSTAGKTLTQVPAPQPTPPTPTPTPAPTLTLGRSEGITQARKALSRRYRSYRRGHARTMTASGTGNPAQRRCRAGWTYRSRRYRATVTVTKLSTRNYRVTIRT
jgi:hypothetical protein